MGEARDFCTIREAAKLSGLAPKTWYQGGAGTSSLPRIRFGRSVRLIRSDVERFINERVIAAEHDIKREQYPNCGPSEDPDDRSDSRIQE